MPYMKAKGHHVSQHTEAAYPTAVSQMMTPGVVQIPGDITVAKAAFLMQKEQIPCLLVKDTDGRIGIVTYTDIVKKVVAQGLEAHDIQIRTVVSRPVHSIEFDRPLEEASTLMAVTGVSLLIVMRHGQPVGVLRARDLVYVAKRCTVRIPATVWTHEAKGEASRQPGTITHLSHLAAAVEGPLMIPAGASVGISFALPGSPDLITAYGRAAAQSKDGESQSPRGWSLEIQFTHLNASDQSQIRLWVAQQPAQDS